MCTFIYTSFESTLTWAPSLLCFFSLSFRWPIRHGTRRNEQLFLRNIFEARSIRPSSSRDLSQEISRIRHHSRENIFLFRTVFKSFSADARFEFVSSWKMKKASSDRRGFSNHSSISGGFSSDRERRSVDSIEKSLLFLLMSDSARLVEENRRLGRKKGRPSRPTCVLGKTFRGEFASFRSEFLGEFDINR